MALSSSKMAKQSTASDIGGCWRTLCARRYRLAASFAGLDPAILHFVGISEDHSVHEQAQDHHRAQGEYSLRNGQYFGRYARDSH